MPWQDDLDQILSRLNVKQEQQQERQQAVECFFIQASRRHPGVFYRMDLAGPVAELRVFIPTNENVLKVRIYEVVFSPDHVLAQLFAQYMTTEGGSPAFQQIEGATTFHLFKTLIETMKALFWLGDLPTLQFPPEINVRCLA